MGRLQGYYGLFFTGKSAICRLLSNIRKVKIFYVKNITTPLENTKYFNRKNRFLSCGASFTMCYLLFDPAFIDQTQTIAKHLYKNYGVHITVFLLGAWKSRKFIEKLSTVAYFLAHTLPLIFISFGLSFIFSLSFRLLLKKMNFVWIYELPHYHQVTAFFPMFFINLFVFRRIFEEYKRLFDWNWLKNHLDHLIGKK